jgi:hypothetical protein
VKKMAKPSCQRLGAKILEWHDGGGSTLYAAGSSLHAGHRISQGLAEQAADHLESLVPAARARQHGWNAKDARSLQSMAARLRRRTCQL